MPFVPLSAETANVSDAKPSDFKSLCESNITADEAASADDTESDDNTEAGDEPALVPQSRAPFMNVALTRTLRVAARASGHESGCDEN